MANTVANLVCFASGAAGGGATFLEAFALNGSPTIITAGMPDGPNGQVLYITIAGAGTQSMSIGGYGATGVQANMAANPGYFSFYILFPNAIPTSQEVIAQIVSATSTLKMQLRINSDGTLALYAADGTTQLGSNGTTVLGVGSWYRIDLKAGNGASANYELRIGQGTNPPVSELSGTGNLAATNCTRIMLGKQVNTNGATVQAYYADLWIDTAGYAPDGYLINPLLSASDGGTQSWTGGTSTSDYTQINAVPPSTAAYVQDPTSASTPVIGTFGVKGMDTSGIPGDSTITAVKAHYWVSDGTTVANTLNIGVNSGGTTSLTSNRNTPSAASGGEELSLMLTNDPFTSTTWTRAGLEACLLDLAENTASVTTRCYFGCLVVGYIPPVGVSSNFFFASSG